MSYEQIIKDTQEMTRRMERKWDSIYVVLILMLATLIILMVKVLWDDHKAKKAKTVPGGYQYRPIVTSTVQIGSDGTEYHRMGIPGKEV